MADDTLTGRSSAPPGYRTPGGTLDSTSSLTGLNEDEAKSFGNMFVVSVLAFLAIAIVAHYLVWQWRPWIPGAQGYPAAVSMAVDAAHAYFA